MLKNLVYFGSPEFSAKILESIILSKQVNVVGVVTTPDKPTGRHQVLTSSPVAALARDYNLPTYKPNHLNDSNLAHLKLLSPDIFLVVSYGQIIPQTWLETPLIGTFNVHFSLLPRYRGALCISEALKNQDRETGVTLMTMDNQLDHGPILDQLKVSISLDDNLATLTTKITQVAIEILTQNLPQICAQNYSQTPQDDSLAVFTPSHKTLTHASALIPWENISRCLSDSSLRGIQPSLPAVAGGNLTPASLHALIRSLSPKPGAWTVIPTNAEGSHSTEIKILQTSIHENKLVIDTVQLAGKQPISWKQFLTGHSGLLSHPLVKTSCK
jgi:methionyl-tRNA formyltransferase